MAHSVLLRESLCLELIDGCGEHSLDSYRNQKTDHFGTKMVGFGGAEAAAVVKTIPPQGPFANL